MKFVKQKPEKLQPRVFDSANRLPRILQRQASMSKNSGQMSTFPTDQNSYAETADPIQEANQSSLRGATEVSDQIIQRTRSTFKHGQQQLSKRIQHSKVRQNTKAPSQAEHKNTRKVVNKIVRQSGKTAASTTVKTSTKAIKSSTQATKIVSRTTQRSLQAMAQSARAATRASIQMAKTTAKAVVSVAKATAIAVKGLASMIAAGGWVAIAIILLIAVIGWLITSPLSIFFTGSRDQTRTVQMIMAKLAQETADQIEQIRIDHGADCDVQIIYEGSEDGSMIQNGADILAVYSVRVSMDTNHPDDVITLDSHKEAVLRDTYHQMVDVSYRVVEVTDASVETDVNRKLQIFVNCRSNNEMISILQLSNDQALMLEELMQPQYQLLYQSLVSIAQPSGLTADEIALLKASLPADLSIMQQDIVDAALSLVGKVQYFWGGKSTAIGWDNRWGTSMEVTAPGSSTIGTVRPFGLDCSGFVAWVYINAGIPDDKIADVFGTHTSTQWKYSVPVGWEDAQIGDLAFFAVPGTTKSNHVGVIVGIESPGIYKIAHCSSSNNRVIVGNTKQIGFKYIRKPAVIADNFR